MLILAPHKKRTSTSSGPNPHSVFHAIYISCSKLSEQSLLNKRDKPLDISLCLSK